MRRLVGLWMSLALLGSVVVGCGDSESEGGSAGGKEASNGTVKLGVLLQLSGAGGVYGPPSRQAAELAVAEINADGGVAGRRVELVVADDATDVKTAQEQAQKLLLQQKVSALVSTETSAARDAVLPVLKRAKSMMIYTPLYEGGACDERLINLGEVPEQQVAPVIPYLQDKHGGNRWYIIGDDYIAPRKLGEAARRTVERLGGKVTGEEYVTLGTSDFSSSIQKIRASNSDFIFMGLIGSDAINFVKQLDSFGLREKVTTYGVAMLDNTLEAASRSSEGLVAAFGYFSTLESDANQKYLADLKDKFGPDAALQTTLSENTYEAIHLWAKAANAAKSVEPDDVLESIGGQTFNGPRGPVTVDGATHHVAQRMYLARVGADQTYKIEKDFGIVEPGPQCSY